MLLQGKIVRNLFIGMVLLNALLIGLFFYASAKQPWLPGALSPGKFGPGLAPEFTGNWVVLSLLLLINAAIITLVGFKDCLHAMWAGLRLSPKTMRRFLNEKAGLASDISGVVAAAVQEEEKQELTYIDRAGWVLRVGLILFGLAMPAMCIALARADAGGVPMFATIEGVAVANNTVSNEEIWRFTGDQVAGALLLDIPEVFHLKASQLEPNAANVLFASLILIYRTLIGFGVLLSVVATMRMRALWRYAMEVAMPVKDIVAMEPALAAGREHTEYRHSRVEPVVHHEPPRHEPVHHTEPAHGNGHDHGHDHGHRHEEHADHGHAIGHDHGHGNGHDHHEEHHAEQHVHGNGHASAYEEEEQHRAESHFHNGHEHDHTGQHHGGHTGERHHRHEDERAE